MRTERAINALTLHDLIQPDGARERVHHTVRGLLRQARWLRERGEYRASMASLDEALRLMRGR